MNPLLSIIIPSLRKSSLIKLLQSIKKNTSVNYELLINSEPGGIYRQVNKEFKKAKGEFVVLIPDDIEVLDGWDAIIEVVDQEPLVVGNFAMAREQINGPGLKVMRPITYYDQECACFPCVRKDITKYLVDFIDPVFNSFYGDIDLSLRAWKEGGRVETAPEAKVFCDNQVDDVTDKSRQAFFDKDEKAFVDRWGKIR